MQLVVPMSGLGSRFVSAGYNNIKPLINVYGRPIIEWTIKAFQGVDRTVFICRDSHVEETNVARILSNLVPDSEIVSIKGHKKGPVYAVMSAVDYVDLDQPVMISYCDYYMHWDFKKFMQDVTDNGCDGAIPCYSGFHPNLIPKANLYASCLVDESDNLIEIREKFSFEENKFNARHSPGAYYFKNAALMAKYCQKMLDAGHVINGEYYNSLVYNHMVADGLRVWAPVNVDYFCQWGTPEDLQEFEFWIDIIRSWKK